MLLTHLQMGYDQAATVASVEARYDGPVEFMDPGPIPDRRLAAD